MRSVLKLKRTFCLVPSSLGKQRTSFQLNSTTALFSKHACLWHQAVAAFCPVAKRSTAAWRLRTIC